MNQGKAVNVTQRITFGLPVALVKKAEILAAQHGISLDELVRAALEQAVEGRKRYQVAGERLLRKSRAGLYEIEAGSWSRDDLHERSRLA